MSEDADPADVGRIVRRHRMAAGLTQEELARQAGLSVRALSDIERGHTSRPYARSLRLLSDALQLDEPARARLMSLLINNAGQVASGAADSDGYLPQPAAAQPGQSEAMLDPEASLADAAPPGGDVGPGTAIRHGSRVRLDRIRWARWSAVGVTAATAGGLWWALSSHGAPPAPVTDGANPSVAHCDVGAPQLASTTMRAEDRTVLGTIEVRYSYQCDAAWARFDPSPAFTKASAVTVTFKIISWPGGKNEVSSAVNLEHRQRTGILLLRGACAQGSALITERGQAVASATTSCQAPP